MRTRKLTEGRRLPWQIGIVEQRSEARAFKIRRWRETGEFRERGIDIHELDKSGALHAGFLAGSTHNQRDVSVILIVRVLAPHAVLAELPAVIAPHDNDRVIGEIQLVERVEKLANLGIGVRQRGVISMKEFERLVGGKRTVLRNVAVVSQFSPICTGERWSVFRSDVIVLGQREVAAFVEVPVLLRRDERQMGLHEADREKERLVTVREAFERLDGHLCHRAVVIGFIGNVSRFGGRSPASFLQGSSLHAALFRFRS